MTSIWVDEEAVKILCQYQCRLDLRTHISVIRNSLLPLPIKCSCWQCSASAHRVGTSIILRICNRNQTLVQPSSLPCIPPFPPLLLSSNTFGELKFDLWLSGFLGSSLSSAWVGWVLWAGRRSWSAGTGTALPLWATWQTLGLPSVMESNLNNV